MSSQEQLSVARAAHQDRIAPDQLRPPTGTAVELDEVMKILDDDEIQQGTMLFLQACDLFKNPVCRHEFKKIKSKEDRATFITWTWNYGKLNELR